MNRGLLPLAAGITTFVVLWWVYASSLQYAALAVVTMGWVVLLQVGLVLVDRFRYAVELPAAKWVAMVVALAAQAYLLLAPNGLGTRRHERGSRQAAGARRAGLPGQSSSSRASSGSRALLGRYPA